MKRRPPQCARRWDTRSCFRNNALLRTPYTRSPAFARLRLRSSYDQTTFDCNTVTMMICAAAPIFAQGPHSGGGGIGRIDFLTGYLSLTDTQKQQAQTIFTAAETAAETARGQLTSARNALTAAVKANQSDTELDRLAAAVGTIEGQLAAISAKTSAKFYALLTAEQKAKYDELGNRGGRGGARSGFGGRE